MIDVKPITLEGHGIRLEPLQLRHAPDLAQAAADGQLWKLRVTSVPEPGTEIAYIETALKGQSEGHRLPWAVLDAQTGVVLGCTSYHDIIANVDRVEIGYTWYRQSVQRSHVNTACKLVLMQHAFETLGCAVVGWRTDIFNFASQRAIERLGAKRDGVIRHHGLRRDGSVRDTVIYSLTKKEWPPVKERLENRLQQSQSAALSSTTTANPVKLVPVALGCQFDSIADLTATDTRINELLRLKPGALGERFVAPNSTSVAQAQVNPRAQLYAIETSPANSEHAANKAVGLMLIWNPTISRSTCAETIEKGRESMLYIWRLMIDFRFHGKGYGTAALEAAKQIAVNTPGITRLCLSRSLLDGHPGPFYQANGFTETGKIEHGEAQMEWIVPK